MSQELTPLKLQQLLDRATADPDLLRQLSNDPLGTARAEGIDLSADHLKHLLGMPEASDQELVDVLRSRMSHAATTCGVACTS